MDSHKTLKPRWVNLSDADWDALTPEQQRAADLNFQLQRIGGNKAATAVSAPSAVAVPDAPSPAAQPERAEVTVTSLRSPDELHGIRNWTEFVTTKEGKTIPASRIRDCIVFQLDIRKDPWWSARMTRGFVKSQAEKLDADTPDDFVYEKNPLFGFKRVRSESGDYLISTIERMPQNEQERKRIRDKFGVTSETVAFLAKRSCQKCKGTGVYDVSSYPGDPVYSRLTETVECECSYE